MAGSLFAGGDVDVVIVGADRIAANGDVANKIGTYTLAVLADRHHVPFYVAAPTTTVDLHTDSGAVIPIEERDSSEVLRFGSTRTAPRQARCREPGLRRDTRFARARHRYRSRCRVPPVRGLTPGARRSRRCWSRAR